MEYWAKKSGPTRFFVRLVRHRLGAVLAKLKNLPLLVRTRPCAALAVEPGYLVDLQKSFGRSKRTHFTNAVEHGIPDGRNAGSLFRSTPDPELAQIGWVLRLQGSRVVRIQFDRGICAQVLLTVVRRRSCLAR